jgi:Ser/Thr protein kinase RdoA (MazF antagonist)
MKDLSITYPIDGPASLSRAQSFYALEWLAKLHAFGWKKQLEEKFNLWSEGCYWHLGTREKEWSLIGEEWKRLKFAAPAISKRLNDKGIGWTLIHGDFKAANILLKENVDESDEFPLAVLDFQYCGGGYGVRDLGEILIVSRRQNVKFFS